jgi:hypothetical protein
VALLDRFLVHSSFLTLGLHGSSKILPNCVSNHKPILLDLFIDENLGPIPFRFSPLCVHQDGFSHLVSSSWSKRVTGNPSFIWEEKLGRLKIDLKNWAKLHSSPVSCRKDVQATLENHQTLMESVPITESISRTESNYQKGFYKACRVEEEYWHQKSRSLWLASGDKNTSYFHKQAEPRKNFKTVKEIFHQDNLVKDFEGIKLATFSHFQDLYTAPLTDSLDPHAYPLSLIPKVIQASDNDTLAAPITMKELKSTLSHMNPDNTPGLDGFTAKFYSNCWNIIKYDLLRMVRNSQSRHKLGGSTKSSFLALILKEQGASNFSRFRPISLCNTGYKVVTKIIANKIKTILPRIIPENQGGFIKGRKILDNVILVQEAIHSSIHQKEKGMAVKLDLVNAFDRVRHDYLFMVMENFGFSPEIIGWIK